MTDVTVTNAVTDETGPGGSGAAGAGVARPLAPHRSSTGEDLGVVELDPAFFGVRPNQAVMHQVVTAQLAAARAGTHSTRTRAEVRGGGAKPHRQKGTGRARQGSIRAPHWVGGGVAGGPKPRDYRQRTPKKMVSLALRSALSDRAALGRVVVVDRWAFPVPKTKDAIAALDALGCNGRILLVVETDDLIAQRSFANIQRVDIVLAGELNCYDILCNDWAVFTDVTLPGAARFQAPEPLTEGEGGSADEADADEGGVATGADEGGVGAAAEPDEEPSAQADEADEQEPRAQANEQEPATGADEGDD